VSLISIGTVGVYRDLANKAERIAASAQVTPGRQVAHPGPATAADTRTGQDAGSLASFGQLLVAQIPSEALLAYTTLLAVFSAAGSGGYKTGRWVLYAASLPACAAVVISAYLAKRNYAVTDDAAHKTKLPSTLVHLPWFPALTAVLAMAVYGLTVPGSPLQASLSSTGFAITAGCLAVAGGLMMSLFTPFLGKGNGATTQPQVLNPAESSNGPVGGHSDPDEQRQDVPG
jgi:bacteriorhodopsin